MQIYIGSRSQAFGLPVVGETWDGGFNDIYGFHVRKEHFFEALDSAKSGVIEEGNVGGGIWYVALWF
ncbi:MAG: P1 family peptidase [Saprospiraceae bacterium]|nr:P1 family peptidase [Saprospiraceae bacterium]